MKIKISTDRYSFEAEGERHEVASLYEVFAATVDLALPAEIAKRANAIRLCQSLFPAAEQ